MAQIIQMRRDTAANWTSVNPTLRDGEFGVEKDTGEIKMGDGVTPWNTLGYVNNGYSMDEANKVANLPDDTNASLAAKANLDGSNLADGAVLSAKRTTIGNMAQVFFAFGGSCNIDTINKNVTFNANFRIAHAKKIWAFTTNKVVNLVVDSALQYVLFNTSTQAFRVVLNGLESTLDENEIVVMTISFVDYNNFTVKSVGCLFDYTINGLVPFDVRENKKAAYSEYPTFVDGVLTQLEEREGSTVRKRSTINYGTNGLLSSIVELREKQTITSTFNYTGDVLTSVTKSLSEGGL